jgi:hypothetical protein
MSRRYLVPSKLIGRVASPEAEPGTIPTPETNPEEAHPSSPPRVKHLRRHKKTRRSASEIVGAKRDKRKKHEAERRARSSRMFVGIRDPKRGDIRKHGLGREQIATIKIPRVFSFLEDPAGAMQTLERIRSIAGRNNIRHIEIDCSDCETLGLCASVVMDVSLMQAKKHRAKRVPLTISGKFSKKSDAVNVLLKASGIPHQMGLPESFLDAELEKRVRRADLLQGTSNRRDRSPQRNIAAEALTKYFDGCLSSLGYELKREGKKYLGNLLTEVIGNAQEHGGSKWYTIGHWHEEKHDGTKRHGRCHIVIFNFGTTICESFALPDVSPGFRERLEILARSHEGKRYFALFGDKWDRETLFTLYALQERVSRFTGLPTGKDRGNGTVDIIDFFTKLSGEKSAKMCIVSGHSYILFDGAYKLQPVVRDNEEFQVVAFNETNDLEEPPNHDYVYRLPTSFPGTIVSIDLMLDEEYLNKVLSKRK